MAKSKELYQRGEIWWYRFTHPRTSEQIRKSTKTSDKKIAQQILDAEKAKAWEEVTQPKKQRRLWVEAATRWLEEKSHKKSISDDAHRLGIVGDAINLIALDEINNDVIREKVVQGILLKRGVKPATINRYITLITSILNLAEREWGWIDRAPKLSKPGKTGERKRKAWLTVDQVNRVYAQTTESSKHRADAMLLSLCTGMRLSNVIRLCWEHVDIPNRRIFIPSELFKGKRDHTVPLNDTAIKILTEWKGKHPARVFTLRGQPFDTINLRWWRKVFDDLGINQELRDAGLLSLDTDEDGNYTEYFVFHGMRHTFATWLARTGTPLEIIEAIGGWKHGDSRQVHVYAHIADVKHLMPYVKKIDDLLDGKIKI